MSITGAKAAAFFDDDATSPTYGTVVQLNHISQDSEFSKEGMADGMISGVELHAADESVLSLGFMDETGITQLEDWKEDETPLKFVLVGLQDNALWYEPTEMRFRDPFNFSVGDRNIRQVMMDNDIPTEDIWSGINLLEGVSGNTVLFPIEGVTVTASADGGTGNLIIEALDKNDGQLATDSVAPGSRASVDLTLPANTYKVKITPPTGATELALRTDGSNEYIAG